MTIAENLKDFVKEIVEESLMDSSLVEVLQESEWFSDLVESVVDDRLNEIQNSEKDSEKDSDKWGVLKSYWTRTPKRKSDGSIAKEYKDSNEDKYFIVRWGDGYPPHRPEIFEIDDLIHNKEWDLEPDFIEGLMDSLPCDKIKFSDPSGDIFFECIGDS